jgi:hypothetical protein
MDYVRAMKPSEKREKYADVIYQKMYDYCGLSKDEPPMPTKYMERTMEKMEVLKEWMGI